MNLTRFKHSATAIGVGLMLIGSALGAQAAEKRYLVVFKSETLPSDAADRIARAGGKSRKALSAIGTVVASGDAVFAELMARDPDVLAVGVEHFRQLPPSATTPVSDTVGMPHGAPTPEDSLYFYQWDIRRIKAPAVWSRLPLPTNGRRATVAVLDTGVADNHPDLNTQIVATKATSYCNTLGGPGNTPSYPKYSSYVDLLTYPDWTPADGCTALGFDVYEGHGTHVSGTIAAKFGGGRAVGVAPEGGIAAYKVFDVVLQDDPVEGIVLAFGAFDGPIFAAIIDAANTGYSVINMSLGGYVDRSTPDGNATWHAWNRVAKYADKKGTLIVASAGNDALNLNGPIAHIPSDLPSVMSTSATALSKLQQNLSTGFFKPAPGAYDLLASYSNFGQPVDIAAPGGDCGPADEPDCTALQYLILSDYIFVDSSGVLQLGYAFAAGTSMATPHVSAVAAMVRALHPDWKPSKVRSHLTSTAEDIGRPRFFGAGMIDAKAAVR